MSYPSPELLPRGAPFIPFLFVQEKTVLLVVFEEIVQFAGSMAVHDYSIGFIVPAQTACIQIGTSHGAHFPIDHDNLGVMEPRRVHPYPATVFHQFVGIVEATIWRQRDVAVGREHYLYLYTTLDSIFERFLEFPVQCEVGVDELDAVLGTVDGVLVEIPDYIIACARLAIDNAHNLFPPTLRGVWFQPCKVRGVGIVTAIILGTMDILPGSLVPHLQEDTLQRIYLVAIQTAMHVMP